jgi:hypothetical protein
VNNHHRLGAEQEGQNSAQGDVVLEDDVGISSQLKEPFVEGAFSVTAFL